MGAPRSEKYGLGFRCNYHHDQVHPFLDLMDVGSLTMASSAADVVTIIKSLESGLSEACRMMSIEDLRSTASALHKLSANVYSKINCHTKIHRLPDELLYLIFKNLLAMEEDYYGYELFNEAMEEVEILNVLIHLTHVCRKWRDLLLDAPSFWACTVYAHPEQFNTYLERSGSAPLSLALKNNVSNIQDVLVEHGWRLRRLDLSIAEENLPLLPLLSFLPSPCILECLTVTDAYRDMLPIGDDHMTTPLLFGQSSLPLKALALVPVLGWLPANSFPSLTHLYLQETQEREDMRIGNVRFLIALLSRSPALQFLTLSCISLDAGDRVLPSTPPIKLARLRSLNILGCRAELFEILSYMSLPSDTFVRLSHVPNIDDPATLQIPRLSLMEDIRALDIALAYEKLQLVADGPSRGLWLNTQRPIMSTHWQSSWRPWMSDILPASMPLSRVVNLRVSFDHDIDIIPALLSHMPQLLELGIRFIYDRKWRNTGEVVDGEHAATVARALHESLGEKGACPQLCALHFEVQLDIGITGMNDRSNYTAMCPPTLVHALEARAESGHPVRRLTIQPVLEHYGGTCMRVVPNICHAFAPVKPFVEDCIVHQLEGHKRTVMFKTRDCWDIDGAETYWNLYPDYDKAPRDSLP
ncbi:hypothetical protein L226DRAFT_212705 [Lentinus tigrinus ALCF2SS1-7]|uniref:F-box domain-containing protein n=1 Tax=Lentinus tigrinus ALCF2SS1-6 TaxID=1328759 RepID=A0A5C2RYS9_9APHY|nr:hypothetical protein L227DRAFT_281684 [Lentinus tigrinus ALCF2SS1-6]RPD71012.1 hypothetical protein L226DRAFT_212705 [Lentinus tigrinus ALCF2SS1-7]